MGVVKGIETCTGEVKCRYVAVARLTFVEDAVEASSLLVGMQGLSEAIDWRRSSKGSCSEADIVCASKLMLRSWDGRGSFEVGVNG